MELKIQGMEDYPNILKYLINQGVDAITDLTMDHIKVLCLNFYFYLIEENRKRTDFSEYNAENKLIVSQIDKLEQIKTKYGLIEESHQIKKLRVLNLENILQEVLQLYKILKISKDRTGRKETINEVHKFMFKARQPEQPAEEE